MVHCSLGHDTTKVINQPQWWPQDVKFSSPLLRPKKINDVSNPLSLNSTVVIVAALHYIFILLFVVFASHVPSRKSIRNLILELDGKLEEIGLSVLHLPQKRIFVAVLFLFGTIFSRRFGIR